MEISPAQVASGVGFGAFLLSAKVLFEIRKMVDEYRDGVIWSKSYQVDQSERRQGIFDEIVIRFATKCDHLDLKGRVGNIETHQTGRLPPATTAIPQEAVQ